MRIPGFRREASCMLNFHMYHRIHCARSERNEVCTYTYISKISVLSVSVYKMSVDWQIKPINGSLRAQNARGTWDSL